MLVLLLRFDYPFLNDILVAQGDWMIVGEKIEINVVVPNNLTAKAKGNFKDNISLCPIRNPLT